MPKPAEEKLAAADEYQPSRSEVYGGTSAEPGSAEKIAVLRERAAAEIELHQYGDRYKCGYW